MISSIEAVPLKNNADMAAYPPHNKFYDEAEIRLVLL
jgi:hypothetical protein